MVTVNFADGIGGDRVKVRCVQNSRSEAPALERTVSEAPASSVQQGRQEPPAQCVPRLEPRNKGAITLCVLLLITMSSTACAQVQQSVQIVQRVWGFDGRVVRGQFVPLSIEIDNLSDEPIEAIAILRSVAGMLRETGGTLMQPVFLGPHSRRWVQFYPFIAGQTTSWRFELQTDAGAIQFDPIQQPESLLQTDALNMKEDSHALIAVVLDRAGVTNKIPGTVKHMPEDIFPPYSTATHGLHAMFLDHVPDWETPRQEAMVSWLKAGGQLHLMRDQNNQTLRFSGVMAALNEPFDEFYVGSGIVTRHDFQRAGLTRDVVAKAVQPQQLSNSDQEEFTQFEKQYGSYGYGQSVAEDDDLFAELRQLTQPEHMWVLIFLLSLCYVGLIFPGCWILSKQRTLHFLVTYGTIAGLACTFSLMFLFIGRRGYGEATSLHSVAIARAEDDTHCSVMQMTTLFVTSGNTYSVDDKDHQTLLASGSSEENVEARITSGNTASFVSRIPPYSSQAIRSRRRIETDNWQLAVTRLSQQRDDLNSLTIVFGDKFPNAPEVKCMVIHGRNVYRAKVDSTKRLIELGGGREPLHTYCQPKTNYTMGAPLSQLVDAADDPDADPIEACFKRMLPDLVRRSFVDDCVQNVNKFRLPEDRIRLLVYAPMLDSQHLDFSGDVRRSGRVLYVRDLLLNPGSENVDVVPR